MGIIMKLNKNEIHSFLVSFVKDKLVAIELIQRTIDALIN